MKYQGKSHKVGDHIDTDAIIPARFLVTTDAKKLGENCMEGLEPNWIKRVSQGDIMVAGRNFGCGSSREHFALIFYRNSFNMGLLLLEIGDEVEKIHDGDSLEVDTDKGIIRNLTTGTEIPFPPLPPSMQDLLQRGGLIPYVQSRLK